MRIPLLITSAINVAAPFVKLVDVGQRVAFTLASIREWMRIDTNIQIVICDGSGYDFKPHFNRTFPNANIECLNFQNNEELVRIRGKGYGEGEIVNYAISNSELIGLSGFFAKCTSKLWVENYPECLDGFNGVFCIEKEYLRRSINNYHRCDSRFYLTEKNFYLQNIADCHKLVDDYQGYYLENALGDAIRKTNIKHVTFKFKPLIYGFSGSTGLFWLSKPDNFKYIFLRRIRYLLGL